MQIAWMRSCVESTHVPLEVNESELAVTPTKTSREALGHELLARPLVAHLQFCTYISKVGSLKALELWLGKNGRPVSTSSSKYLGGRVICWRHVNFLSLIRSSEDCLERVWDPPSMSYACCHDDGAVPLSFECNRRERTQPWQEVVR